LKTSRTNSKIYLAFDVKNNSNLWIIVINYMSKSAIWGGVFETRQDDLMRQINESISFDKRLYKQDIWGSVVHAKMLAKQGIISEDDAVQIANGLRQIEEEIESGEFEFKVELEDIHMNIEARLTEIIGESAKRLHTARSRNDQVATDFKIYTREAFGRIEGLLGELISTLRMRADDNESTILPGFTHLQIAQPLTLKHYLLAYSQMFMRDLERISDFTVRLNQFCPLGSGALAGVSYETDRFFTADELGFEMPSANSLDSVSDRDFALDFLYACSVISVHLSRLAEEIIIWASQSFGFITLPDEFSTGSSIMPQKRNPDAAELIRGKTGRIFGNLQSLLVVLKGLSLAYSKDMQEDKEAMFDSFDNICLCLLAMDGMVQKIIFDPDKMRESALKGYANATDLADYLVQKCGLAFRQAHHITGELVRLAMQNNLPLENLTLSQMQSICPEIAADIFEHLTLEACIKAKKSYGGTGSPAI
jgi:argininosuccinate lyase